MKAVGIVRHIDDLGRVELPKEILHALNVREGDQIEIYTDNEGGAVLRKYQTPNENIAEECAKIVSDAMVLGEIAGMFVHNHTLTLCTPKGTTSIDCYPNNHFNLNVSITVALSQLGYCELPESLSD